MALKNNHPSNTLKIRTAYLASIISQNQREKKQVKKMMAYTQSRWLGWQTLT